MEQVRDKAAAILNRLEKVLEENDVIVPCSNEKDRKECEDAARLFGDAYYNLEDAIVRILENEGINDFDAIEKITEEVRKQLRERNVELLDCSVQALELFKTKLADVMGYDYKVIEVDK